MKFRFFFLFLGGLVGMAAMAQEDLPELQFIMGKDGKLTAVPTWQASAFEITLPKVAYKTFTPSNPLLITPLSWGKTIQVGRYKASDRVTLFGWGIYPSAENAGGVSPYQMNPLLNTTTVGGGVKFKIGDNASFGVSVHYNYNRYNPYQPAFRSGNGGGAEVRVGW